MMCKVNSKPYIGQTRQTLQKRLSQHSSAAKYTNKKYKMCCAVRKYGIENFSIEQICTATEQEDANRLESEYIQKYDSIKLGYNICSNGSAHSQSKASKDKMALARTGKKASEKTKKLMSEQHSGDKNIMYGKHHTQNTKDIISSKNKGQSGYWIGKPMPQDIKNKISASRKNLTVGENNPGAKLTLVEVEEIKILLQNPNHTRQLFADMFNVSLSTIKRIKAGTHWK